MVRYKFIGQYWLFIDVQNKLVGISQKMSWYQQTKVLLKSKDIYDARIYHSIESQCMSIITFLVCVIPLSFKIRSIIVILNKMNNTSQKDRMQNLWWIPIELSNRLEIVCPYLWLLWTLKFYIFNYSSNTPISNSSQRGCDREKNLNTFLHSTTCSNFYWHCSILWRRQSRKNFRNKHGRA